MKNDALTESLTDLGTKLGPDILTLPIKVFPLTDDKRQPRAYTNPEGIFIRQDMYEKYPQFVNIVIAHEIGHHVVGNKTETWAFDNHTVNCAEDYVINHLIHDKFGYDVRKLPGGGLYNSKYRGKTPKQVAKLLVGGQAQSHCNCMGSAHPIILSVAHRLRKRWFGTMDSPFFIIDAMDRQIYESVTDTAHKVQLHQPAEVRDVIQGVWEHLYLNKPVAHRIENRKLNSAEALVYCYDGKMLRDQTMQRPEEAMLSAVMFVRQLNNDRMWVEKKKDTTSKRLIAVRQEMRYRKRTGKATKNGALGKMGIRKLRLALVRAVTAEKKWRNAKPLSDLLISDPVYAKAWEGKKQGAPCLKTMFDTSDERLLPSLRSNETVRRIRSICRRSIVDSNKFLKELEKLLKKLGITLGDLLNGPGGLPQQAPSEGDGAGTGIPTVEVPGSKKKGEGDGDGVKKKPTRDEILAGAKPGGQQAGRGNGSARRVNVMDLLLNNMDDLMKIMEQFDRFDAEFSKHSRKRTSEREAAASSITFDNDVAMALQSELGLLGSKKTRPVFFSKIADSSIMQTIPQNPLRKAIQYYQDGSGSMNGEPYQVSAGFGLAMLKHLSKDNRGMVIGNFSSSVNRYFVYDGKGNVKWAEALMVLANPTMGGTSFVKPLEHAVDVRRAMGWNKTQTILSTDGYGSVPEGFTAEERKRGHSYVMVSTNKQSVDEVTASNFNSMLHVKRKDQFVTLVDLGIKAL